MLLLTRKCGERIHIGDDIVITVVKVENGKVRLGIEAPTELGTWREELLATIGHEIAMEQGPGDDLGRGGRGNGFAAAVFLPGKLPSEQALKASGQRSPASLCGGVTPDRLVSRLPFFFA